MTEERNVRFTNWSGSLSFTASRQHAPQTEEEVASLVRRAAQRGAVVRPVGSGHSSTPLVETSDELLSLDNMRGVVAVDKDARQVTVLPGTGLADLGEALADAGLAMENLGDVDYQAIAGAIGTGTHGTGERLGNLSSTLVGGRLVTGTGEIVPFGVDAGEAHDSELTRAAQVSLGALGVLTSLTLRVRPAYELHRHNVMTHIDWVLDHFDELAASYRHVDFYWYPRSDRAQVRVLDEPGGLERGGSLDDLRMNGRLKREERGPSYEIIPNAREIEFDEMEYMLPREAGLAAFREVRDRVKTKHRANVAWRLLVRTIAPDRGMLSTAFERETLTIALLQNTTLDYRAYFEDVEPIFLRHGGRPHWGKKHTRAAEELGRMYPHWDRFLQLRRELDPDGVFLNDYLRSVLGEEGARDDQ
ncbi:oxidoreductase [Pseudoclavibacter endophyticus]|uniref:FAD-binding protein n=1 Tax=Pseudoclavibacter endophyticus TaxID=1778590 RepID=A0A6H9WLN2_9MICO|nr:D-arabinono-1,4-lactone oxidase [Pseudoclavibacter endophyticus]KAB1646822.1 FAD-binding protein [Pseudoclavibacter endophyticus]GGA75254.1 oxidoreductase [Pseudoclavibacter endophyticus]